MATNAVIRPVNPVWNIHLWLENRIIINFNGIWLKRVTEWCAIAGLAIAAFPTTKTFIAISNHQELTPKQQARNRILQGGFNPTHRIQKPLLYYLYCSKFVWFNIT